MKTIGERLSWARLKAGFKKATDAARHYGWNENTYRSHENGTRDPRIDVAKKYASAFKVDFNWLFLGEDRKKPGEPQSEIMQRISDKLMGFDEPEQREFEDFIDFKLKQKEKDK